MSECIACDLGHRPTEMFVMNVDFLMPIQGPTTKRPADFTRRAPEGIYAYVQDRDKDQLVYSVIYIRISGFIQVSGKNSPVSHLNLNRYEFLGWVRKIGSKFFAQKATSDRPRRKGSSSLRKATAWLR